MNPYAQSGNEVVDRGTRLHQLKQSPGFLDLYALSQSLVEQATDACIRFGGWDRDQIAALQQRAKACQEFHERLFSLMSESIAAAFQQSLETKPEREKAAEADQLRQSILAEDEIRIPGSY